VAYNSVPIFIRLAVVASHICEILRKFELIAVQGHPKSSIFASIKSANATFYLLIVKLHSFSRCWLPNLRNLVKFRENSNIIAMIAGQDHPIHRSWCQSKAHMQLTITH